MVLGGFQVGCKSNISKPTFMHAKVLVFDTLCGIEKTISQRPIQLGKEKRKRKRKNQPILWAVSDVHGYSCSFIPQPGSLLLVIKRV